MITKKYIETIQTTHSHYFGSKQLWTVKSVKKWDILINNNHIIFVLGSSQLANLAIEYFQKEQSTLKGWDSILSKSSGKINKVREYVKATI
jgi:hypothetical protein